MKEKMKSKNLISRYIASKEENKLQGYPIYPGSEDIYKNYLEEKEINPEDISKTKDPNENNKVGKSDEIDYLDDISGSDLDIPGSELDDYMENIGSEDEENNYYSLGGDNHDNLEEEQGE